MRLPKYAFFFALLASTMTLASAADDLADGWSKLQPQTKPWCYWFWLNNQISRDGITRDLETMSRMGIGEALLFNIFLKDKPDSWGQYVDEPVGEVKVLSDEWWGLVRHAMREGERVGVNVGIFNCLGWSMSGGPWIKPTQAMRYVVSSETRVVGPCRFEAKLPIPREPFQDIAVLAFPAPLNDADTLATKSPRIVCRPEIAGAQKLVDGDLASVVHFPIAAAEDKSSLVIEIQLAEPLTVRTLELVPGEEGFSADCELLAEQPDGGWKSVRKFKCDRSHMMDSVGPMPRGPVAIALAPVTAKHFRVVFTDYVAFADYFVKRVAPSLAEINLFGAARLESFVEKQLGKMHPTPLPMWDAYLWPGQGEPDDARLSVPVGGVRDLTKNLAPDGTLRWEAPAGEWTVLRTGMTPTGVKNVPAAPEARGLEADKMSHAVIQEHIAAFIGEVLRRVPAEERKAFTRVVADSYEVGSENWTDDFAAAFKAAYHYDPIPWMPVLSGRLVGGADQSERFLWDMRRLVADRIASEYVGGLRDAVRSHGLGLWLQNYGHWGYPGEFLNYGGASDRISGEFWATGELGSIECRAATSAANTYGKRLVSAESFTGGPPFQSTPRTLKARGDWSFCEGINHVVLHLMIHQPWEDRVPGMNAPFGTEFNRHNTWFEQSSAWLDYERRCCWLLQQGWRAADVAYFIGEDAPKMTGVRQPTLPAGRDFDYINAEVIETKLDVRDNRLVLPHGVSYRVLVLPELTTMRPAVLRKIRDLVRAGATVLGPAPVRSPSLVGYPECDAEVRQLAEELWGHEPAASGTRAVGRGRIVWGRTLEELFAEDKFPADVEFRASADAKLLFTHRTTPDAEIYFVSNQGDRAETAECVFRVKGRQPELWDAVTGARRDLPEWVAQDHSTVVPLSFAPQQSWFVVFRRPAEHSPTTEKNFPALAALATLSGEWDVSFDPKWGGPAAVKFTELTDWSKHADAGIKFYSGRAVYRKVFESPSEAGPNAGVWLDLGEVKDIAVVRLNGHDLVTLWTAPWRVDVSAALQPGPNTLEIEVINPWNNRLVGDAALPPEQRRTSLTLATVKPDAPLMPAGLFGPVTLQVAQ